MVFTSYIISILETIILTLPVLIIVAFVTVAERKTMASMQRRLGPNVVGYYGLLQAFADALKLLLKEYVSPTQANILLFFLGPIITLIFSLLGFGVIPFSVGLSLFDFNLGILFLLAVSSLATYGILLAGWSANSKYAFLGSLRSTAQLISYELILSSAIFVVVLLTNSLNLTANIEFQKSVFFLFPLSPILIMFFIGAVAETNRAPFDLAEAESELVSGFMTEHSSVIFVFFFLAEYASIILICIVTAILFLGGYNIDINSIISLLESIRYLLLSSLDSFIYTIFYYLDFSHYTNIICSDIYLFFLQIDMQYLFSYNIVQNITEGIILSVKSFTIVFTFIWVRASFPRIRFDQLMSYCWTILLPLVFALIILVICYIYTFDFIANNILFS